MVGLIAQLMHFASIYYHMQQQAKQVEHGISDCVGILVEEQKFPYIMADKYAEYTTNAKFQTFLPHIKVRVMHNAIFKFLDDANK